MNRRFNSICIVLLSSLLIAPIALAGPKEDVSAATASWATILGEDNPDTILPLYATDAVLWGTLSPTVRSDRAALSAFFKITTFKKRNEDRPASPVSINKDR